MKNIILLLSAYMLSIPALAQVPQTINYQAIYQDDVSTGIYKKSTVAVIISIIQGTLDGEEIFTEAHSITTNDKGLFTLQIGSVNTEDFANINWADGPYFLGVNVNGTDFGISQILSVPYARLAMDVINNNDEDADPTNELQTISLNEHVISLSHDGGEIALIDEINDADADPENELQELSIIGDTIHISQGNSIVIPPRIVKGVVDNDGSILYGNGFSVNNPEQGYFIITFTETFSRVPAVVATPYGIITATDALAIQSISETGCIIRTGLINGTILSRKFSFIAIE